MRDFVIMWHSTAIRCTLYKIARAIEFMRLGVGECEWMWGCKCKLTGSQCHSFAPLKWKMKKCLVLKTYTVHRTYTQTIPAHERFHIRTRFSRFYFLLVLARSKFIPFATARKKHDFFAVVAVRDASAASVENICVFSCLIANRIPPEWWVRARVCVCVWVVATGCGWYISPARVTGPSVRFATNTI